MTHDRFMPIGENKPVHPTPQLKRNAATRHTTRTTFAEGSERGLGGMGRSPPPRNSRRTCPHRAALHEAPLHLVPGGVPPARGMRSWFSPPVVRPPVRGPSPLENAPRWRYIDRFQGLCLFLFLSVCPRPTAIPPPHTSSNPCTHELPPPSRPAWTPPPPRPPTRPHPPPPSHPPAPPNAHPPSPLAIQPPHPTPLTPPPPTHSIPSHTPPPPP
jgi:hypothetical protein